MRAESTRRKNGLGGQKMKQNIYRIAENRALTESRMGNDAKWRYFCL